MKNKPKYYPPEMEPHWTDWIFKYWDWLKLGVWFVISLFLIWFWIEVWSWVGTMTRSYLGKI